MTQNILNGLVDFLAPVVAICLIIYVFIQGGKLISGSESGSFKKLIIGVLIFLFILGIMYAAGSFETYGKLFASFTGSAIEQVGEEAEQLLR